MKIVELPNGFVLDLDCVDFIGSDIPIRSPFPPCVYTGYVEFSIFCRGKTTIIIYTSEEQSKEIHNIIQNYLKERTDYD